MIYIIRVVALSFLLLVAAGCAKDKSVLQGGTSVTASINNPVTKTMLYDVENGLVVAVSGTLAYKRACAAKSIPRSCRAVVATLQSYTRRAKPILVELRNFVKNNDQINAITAYNTVRGILLDFNNTASTAPGVN